VSWRNILPLLRLHYAPILLVTQYLGLVLAIRQVLPFHEPDIWMRWVLAVLSFLAGFGLTFLLNDVVDLEDDRANPRRQASPLVRGLVSSREALAWALGLLGVSLLLAACVSWEFLLVILVRSAIVIAYSVRPVRFKERAGLDILAQAGSLGLIFPLSGWTIARGFAGFPWWFHVHFVLALAGPLLLVMLFDQAADEKRGIRTSAVALGSRGTVRASLFAMGVALLLLVAFAAQRYIITPRFLLYTLVLAGLQIVFLPKAIQLRDDPVGLKRYIYSKAWNIGLLPYLLWALYLGGILPA
jgi:lycopene elongase/hydratase (dihydrobisanhydrobacterioruberin-forming)